MAPKSASPSKKKKGGTPRKPRKPKVPKDAPTAEAEALLAEALRGTAPAPAQAALLSDGETAAGLFDDAFDAAQRGDLDATLAVLQRVRSRGLAALLQALLQAQTDTSASGYTLLHQAAWHGDARGVRELLRLGADASRLNMLGESSLDVACAQVRARHARARTPCMPTHVPYMCMRLWIDASTARARRATARRRSCCARGARRGRAGTRRPSPCSRASTTR